MCVLSFRRVPLLSLPSLRLLVALALLLVFSPRCFLPSRVSCGSWPLAARRFVLRRALASDWCLASCRAFRGACGFSGALRALRCAHFRPSWRAASALWRCGASALFRGLSRARRFAPRLWRRGPGRGPWRAAARARVSVPGRRGGLRVPLPPRCPSRPGGGPGACASASGAGWRAVAASLRPGGSARRAGASFAPGRALGGGSLPRASRRARSARVPRVWVSRAGGGLRSAAAGPGRAPGRPGAARRGACAARRSRPRVSSRRPSAAPPPSLPAPPLPPPLAPPPLPAPPPPPPPPPPPLSPPPPPPQGSPSA